MIKLKTIKSSQTIGAARSCSGGFTAIELLIAMALFSSLLTLTVVGFIQVSQMYQQGLAAKKTQEAARYILEDISRNGRESDFIEVKTAANGFSVLCTQNFKYAVNGNRLHKYRRTVESEPVQACSSEVGADSDETAITSPELKVLQFRVRPYNQAGDGHRSAEVVVRIATIGTDDLLDDAEERCVPSRTGSHFCSVSELTGIFTARGGL